MWAWIKDKWELVASGLVVLFVFILGRKKQVAAEEMVENIIKTKEKEKVCALCLCTVWQFFGVEIERLAEAPSFSFPSLLTLSPPGRRGKILGLKNAKIKKQESKRQATRESKQPSTRPGGCPRTPYPMHALLLGVSRVCFCFIWFRFLASLYGDIYYI